MLDRIFSLQFPAWFKHFNELSNPFKNPHILNLLVYLQVLMTIIQLFLQQFYFFP